VTVARLILVRMLELFLLVGFIYDVCILLEIKSMEKVVLTRSDEEKVREKSRGKRAVSSR
jgi:hypothetical protein